jgi:hypothetical protein
MWANDLGTEGGRACFTPGRFTESKYRIGHLYLTRTNLNAPTIVHECFHAVAYELRDRSKFDEEWICRQGEKLFAAIDKELRSCQLVK